MQRNTYLATTTATTAAIGLLVLACMANGALPLFGGLLVLGALATTCALRFWLR